MRQVLKAAEFGQLALIALGSNATSPWGNARETVQKAMTTLELHSEKPAIFSTLYRSPAFPPGAGPDFVNAAMAISTNASPEALLAALHLIEAQAGRVRDVRWGPRTLDLDLIGQADLILPDPETQAQWRNLSPQAQRDAAPAELILPHPRLQDRAFVLKPLADIAPNWQHPLLGQSIAALLSAYPKSERDAIVALD